MLFRSGLTRSRCILPNPLLICPKAMSNPEQQLSLPITGGVVVVSMGNFFGSHLLVQENGDAIESKDPPLVPAKNGKLTVELNSHFTAHFIIKVFFFCFLKLFLVWNHRCSETRSTFIYCILFLRRKTERRVHSFRSIQHFVQQTKQNKERNQKNWNSRSFFNG